MNGSYLLDTNVIIALFAGEEAVLTKLENARVALIPTIALGELYYGAFRSGRTEENLARIERFASQATVLVCDAETGRRYGEVKNQLSQRGRPIPENDIWIAALALQYGLSLATRDAHFNEISDLTIENW